MVKLFLTNLRYTWRAAQRQLIATVSIILLLALGMGGVTAVFNPIYSMFFTPLLLPKSERLVRIGGSIPMFNIFTSRFENEKYLWRIFSNMAAYRPYQAKIRMPDTGKHLEVNALLVTDGFFETLGVKPLIGYDFNSIGNRTVFLVSHRFWRKELMQKTDVIGSYILSSDGSQISIVGIMPENFNFPYDTDIWEYRKSGRPWGGSFSDPLQFVGRLHPGISSGAAEKELRAINFKQLGQQLSTSGPVLQSLQTFLYGDQKPILMMLGAAAILFLVLVSVGVVNILIAQGTNRKHEIALRLIFGASRRNLVFQLLREILPLVIIGGLAGWWIAEVAGNWLNVQFPTIQGNAVSVSVKIAFWASLVLIVTFISGLVPSLYATSLDLNTYLKSASGDKRQFFSSRELLVGIQLSLTLALLVGVGLLLRSMMFNVDIPIGWSSRDVAVISVDFPNSLMGRASDGTTDISKQLAVFSDVRRALRGMPEVIAVGTMFPIPFSVDAITLSRSRTTVSKTLSPQGKKIPTGMPNDIIRIRVSPEVFDVLGIPIVIGRSFTEIDLINEIEVEKRFGYGITGGVVIINQALAQRLWQGESPVGKVFYDSTSASHEVIGVVKNFHHVPGNKDFIPAIYAPTTYEPLWTGITFKYECLIKLRPNTSINSFLPNARQRLSGYALEWLQIKPLSKEIEPTIANQRMTLQLLGCFAVLGIIISGFGVYATATLMAVARNREMGIRMALGAQTWDIFRLALWRGVRVILIGLPLGLFLSLILSKILSNRLVFVNIDDPLVWVISCAVLFFITIIAALIPALRAIRGNPLDVLRNE